MRKSKNAESSHVVCSLFACLKTLQIPVVYFQTKVCTQQGIRKEYKVKFTFLTHSSVKTNFPGNIVKSSPRPCLYNRGRLRTNAPCSIETCILSWNVILLKFACNGVPCFPHERTLHFRYKKNCHANWKKKRTNGTLQIHHCCF